jgi:tetratricopeptide (TPR) repeat protein
MAQREAFAAGTLPPAASAAMHAHVASCPTCREAIEPSSGILRAVQGDQAVAGWSHARVVSNLASVLRQRGQLLEAEMLFREAIAMTESADPNDVFATSTRARAQVRLARLLVDAGRSADAEPFVRSGLAALRAEGEDAAAMRNAGLTLADCLAALGRLDEATREREAARAILVAHAGSAEDVRVAEPSEPPVAPGGPGPPRP